MEYNFNLNNISGVNTQAINVSNIANVRLMSGNTNATLLNSTSNNGIILNGVVQSSSLDGTISLQTDLGNINFHSNIVIKKSAEMSLKIEQKNNELIAKIISIDGVSPAKYAAIQNNHNLNVDDEVTTSSNLIVPPNIDSEGDINIPQNNSGNLANPIIRGVFLQPVKLEDKVAKLNPIIAANNLIKAGSSLQLQITNILIPDEVSINDLVMQNNSASYNISEKSTINNQSQNGNAPLIGNSNKVIASPNNPVIKTEIAQPITNDEVINDKQPTTNVDIGAKNLNITAAKTLTNLLNQYVKPPINQAMEAFGNIVNTNAETNMKQFSGVVLEQASNREITLQSDIGMVKLFLTTPLPKGSIVNFNLLQIEQVRGSDLPESVVLPNIINDEMLESLSEIVDLKHIGSLNAAVNNNMQSHIIPRLGATLTSELIFLLSAVKAGDLEDFISAPLKQKIAQSVDGDAKISKLKAAFQHLKQDFKLEADNNWQHMLIPLYDGEKINPINLFLKQQKGNKATKTNDVSHFMLELTLDNLGLMQFDGLVQRNKNIAPIFKQFDLIIRSEKPLINDMKQHINQIFNEYCQISGSIGVIQFRGGSSAIIPPPKIDMTAINLDDLIV
jgi:hypothetical protein